MSLHFYFAWVDETETAFSPAHARDDEDVFSFEISQVEGDFAAATVAIRNPRVGLLNPGRKQWAWISRDGSVPLFFGRLLGAPENLQEEIVTVAFRARPNDYDVLKAALAATLRVAPFYDPVWIEPSLLDDPDVVLESRTQLYHIDRLTHDVTVSDIISGEDGTVTLTTADILEGSLNMSYGQTPVRSVNVTGTVSWTQTASGTIDITRFITDAFAAAGTGRPYVVSSFTGQGLYDNWPNQNDNIGGGWSVGFATIDIADGVSVPRKSKTVHCKYRTTPTTPEEMLSALPIDISFRDWFFSIYFPVVYDASRSRTETVTFTLSADIQSLLTDPGDDDTLAIALSSSSIGAEIDGDGSNVTTPIGDLGRRQYFTTERGEQSLQYLIAVARARLLARARTVEISADIPFDLAQGLSCRQNITIIDARLPGGTATGKITGYAFSADGSSGELKGSVKIGCTIGNGTALTPALGTPVYVEPDYFDDVQIYAGAETLTLDSSITYVPIADAPQDDGIDFLDLRPEDIIESTVNSAGITEYSITVTNGETAQAQALNHKFIDVAAAVSALNAVYTSVDLILKPVDAGPFDQAYSLAVSSLVVPKLIDLGV